MNMLFLILFALQMSFQHSTCLDICTENHLCLPVDEALCDESMCLRVRNDDIDEIISKGANITKWNTLRTILIGTCPIGLKFEPAPRCTHINEVHGTFIHHYGESCNHSVSMERTFESNIEEDGYIQVLTSQIGDMTYKDCIIYFEKGKNFIMRRCQADSCDGACASILVVEVMETYNRKLLEAFIKYMNLNLNNDVVDCVI